MWLTRKITTYRAFSPLERRVVRKAVTLLAVTPAALRVLGMTRWLARLDSWGMPLGPDVRLDPDQSVAADRTARLVAAAARNVWPQPTCLHRSIVLISLLRAQQIEGVIRYGVRRRKGQFEAHAWVENHGRPITEPGDPYGDYAALHNHGVEPSRGL